MNIAKLFHRKGKSQRVTTIDDLLTSDDVKEILKDLVQGQAKIKDLVVCWTDRDGSVHAEVTDDTLESMAVWMLESAKKWIMTEEE